MKQATCISSRVPMQISFYEEVESYIYNEPEDSHGYPILDTRLITFHQRTK